MALQKNIPVKNPSKTIMGSVIHVLTAEGSQVMEKYTRMKTVYNDYSYFQ